MISSLRSKFDRSRRRSVMLAGESITVYQWENGGLTDSFVFDADDAGLFQFARYLQESPNSPIYFLVDVVEEEYRQDTIPHVFGADRSAVLKRKQSRLFRGTDYVHVLGQGREAEGRKDDRILFTALTNPDALKPWIGLFERYKVPLAGVYSLPILSKHLVRKLHATSNNLLLVTLQSASGLRQTYFRDQQLRLSRLAKMPRFGTAAYEPLVMSELDKVRRYLTSMRLLSREDPLDIHILAHGELLDDLRKSCKNSSTSRYHLVDVAAFAGQIGIEGVVTTTFSDILYAQLLLDLKTRNHYASSNEVRYHTMYKARMGMLTASMIMLLGSATLSGFVFLEGIMLNHDTVATKEKTQFYEERNRIARSRLPKAAVTPNEIKAAVGIVDTLEQYKSSPFDAMGLLSRTLTGFPALQLDQVKWTAADGNTYNSANAASAEPVTLARQYLHYQMADITGRVEPFDGDYRSALDLVRRFADSLRALPDVVDVKIEQLPLDIRSDSSLSGSAEETQEVQEAVFAVKVVIGSGNASA